MPHLSSEALFPQERTRQQTEARQPPPKAPPGDNRDDGAAE
jgi:hypothetical protein